MEINVELKEKESKAELKIKADAEELKPFLEEAAKALSKKHSLPGFRPGKAPVAVIAEKLGKDTLLSAALDTAVPRLFVEAVLSKDIEALGRPAVAIEEADIDKGVTFTATVAVLPKVKVGDATKINVEKKEEEVDDERVEQELKAVAKSRGNFIDVTRPAKEGDTVHADFEVMMDGKPMEGGSSKNHPIQLGEGHFIPDFETKLQGIQAGDTREFDMIFPSDFPNKQLAGKKADAKVTAHSIKKQVLPKLDDEFAKGLGDFKDMADLKGKLKENMAKEFKSRADEKYKSELAEKLAEISEYPELPETLVDGEIDRRVEELQQMLQVQQKTLEDYLKEQDKSPEDLRKELREPAVKTVKVSLAMRSFADDQKIEVTDEEIEAKVKEYLQQFKDAEEATKNFDVEDLKKRLEHNLQHQKALDKLAELASS